MKMLSTDLLMRSILWLHMSGGKDQYTVYFLFWHILVPGLGSNGEEEKKSIVFKSTLNPNTTIHVFVLAGHGLSIKAWRSVIRMHKCYLALSKKTDVISFKNHQHCSQSFAKLNVWLLCSADMLWSSMNWLIAAAGAHPHAAGSYCC